MTTNQKGSLTRPAGVLLVIAFKGIWLSAQKIVVRFAEVNNPHHAFTMLHKARQVKHESS